MCDVVEDMMKSCSKENRKRPRKKRSEVRMAKRARLDDALQYSWDACEQLAVVDRSEASIKATVTPGEQLIASERSTCGAISRALTAMPEELTVESASATNGEEEDEVSEVLLLPLIRQKESLCMIYAFWNALDLEDRGKFDLKKCVEYINGFKHYSGKYKANAMGISVDHLKRYFISNTSVLKDGVYDKDCLKRFAPTRRESNIEVSHNKILTEFFRPRYARQCVARGVSGWILIGVAASDSKTESNKDGPRTARRKNIMARYKAEEAERRPIGDVLCWMGSVFSIPLRGKARNWEDHVAESKRKDPERDVLTYLQASLTLQKCGDDKKTDGKRNSSMHAVAIKYVPDRDVYLLYDGAKTIPKELHRGGDFKQREDTVKNFTESLLAVEAILEVGVKLR